MKALSDLDQSCLYTCEHNHETKLLGAGILVSLGSITKIPRTGWLKHYSSLIVLEAEKSKIVTAVAQVSGESPLRGLR